MVKKLLAVGLAFIYSFLYVLIGPMTKQQDIDWKISLIPAFLICFLICTAINYLFLIFLPNREFKFIKKMNETLSTVFGKLSDRKLFLIFWAFIVLMWVPAFLLLFPGIFSYDMINQTYSALYGITDNHHPVLHNWLIGVFLRIGNRFFGDYGVGLGFLSLLQVIILSYALARLVMLLKKKGVPALVVLLTEFGSALWFMNACLAVTMIKDTLHAAFLVLFACHFVEIATSVSEYIKQKRNYILFPIVSFFMCAFRNNGLHIYVFCFAVLVLLKLPQIIKYFKSERQNNGTMAKILQRFIPLLLVIILPVVGFSLYKGPFFKAMGIEQGQIREALCIPIQQISRVAVKRESELTDVEKAQIGVYLDDLNWMDPPVSRPYNPHFADPAKSCFYSANYEADPLAFWKFYIKLGLAYPSEYVEAFLSNTLGYWYPGYYGFSYVMIENYSSDSFAVPLMRKSILNLEWLDAIYKSLCGSEIWRQIWGIRLFFVPAYAPWILIYALILSWRKKRYLSDIVPMFLPCIAQLGIMFLSPMSSFRYSWPFFLLMPILFIGIFCSRAK
ncbi:MAG: DUF6020 family protein [Lachnospiraceae bacterium]|nr:DUF6020 family protein [Lachnospiraceae bacterium]